MIISCIVATAENRVIGKDNDIPWYLPADLKYFKKVTLGSPIIMGRKVYESIGRPLPKRRNIVLTRNPFFISSGIEVAHSLDEALAFAKETNPEKVFIIGGGVIYKDTIDLWDELYLTEVDLAVEGDVFFPEIAFNDWVLESEKAHEPDEKNKFPYTFKVYKRK